MGRDLLRRYPDRLTVSAVEDVARELGLSRTTTYRLIKRYRAARTVEVLLDRPLRQPKRLLRPIIRVGCCFMLRHIPEFVAISRISRQRFLVLNGSRNANERFSPSFRQHDSVPRYSLSQLLVPPYQQDCSLPRRPREAICA